LDFLLLVIEGSALQIQITDNEIVPHKLCLKWPWPMILSVSKIKDALPISNYNLTFTPLYNLRLTNFKRAQTMKNHQNI